MQNSPEWKVIAFTSWYSFLHTQDDYEGIWNVVAFLVAFICCVLQVNVVHMFSVHHKLKPAHVKLFLTLFLHVTEPLSCPQCHLYLFHSALKKHKSFALLSMIVLCNLYLLGLRNVWQLIFHISVASLSTLLILTRKLQDRTNDCGVWGAEDSVFCSISHHSRLER